MRSLVFLSGAKDPHPAPLTAGDTVSADGRLVFGADCQAAFTTPSNYGVDRNVTRRPTPTHRSSIRSHESLPGQVAFASVPVEHLGKVAAGLAPPRVGGMFCSPRL